MGVNFVKHLPKNQLISLAFLQPISQDYHWHKTDVYQNWLRIESRFFCLLISFTFYPGEWKPYRHSLYKDDFLFLFQTKISDLEIFLRVCNAGFRRFAFTISETDEEYTD